MKQSGFLKRQERKQASAANAMAKVVSQFYTDTAQIALHRMGWGYQRAVEFTALWKLVQTEYRPALFHKDVEADVAQEHMDRELRDICKGNQALTPFAQRYPELKKVEY